MVLPQSERGVDLRAHKPQETCREGKKYDFLIQRVKYVDSGDPLCFSIVRKKLNSATVTE